MFSKTQIKRDKMKMIPYTIDIRSIIFVMLCTRPNASYTLNLTSRYQFNPGKSH